MSDRNDQKPDASADEAGLVAAAVRLVELLVRERADPLQQLELVAEVGPHHLGAVGGDRERDAVLLERIERVPERLLVRERLREQVRRGADLEHGAGLAEEA